MQKPTEKPLKEANQVWHSRAEIEPSRISITKRRIAELPSFVDAWKSNQSTKCIWTSPLTEVEKYGTSKAAMQSKYATK